MERTFYGKSASFLIKHTSGKTHLQFHLREQPRHSDAILSCPHDTTAHSQVGDMSLWRGYVLILLKTSSVLTALPGLWK